MKLFWQPYPLNEKSTKSDLYGCEGRGLGHVPLGVPEPAALGAVAVRQVHVARLGAQNLVRRDHDVVTSCGKLPSHSYYCIKLKDHPICSWSISRTLLSLRSNNTEFSSKIKLFLCFFTIPWLKGSFPNVLG